MVDDFVITDSEGKFNILSDIRRVTANVDEARQYVGTVKALMAVQTRALVKLNTAFAQNPTKANHEALMTGWQVEQELLFNGSGLSKASSDLLNSYKKNVRAINDEAVIQKELQKE